MLVAVALAAAWNVFPLASSLGEQRRRTARPNPKMWPAPVAYLHAHLRTGYRVEAVDTVDHWPALYLAAGEHPARARLVPAGRPSRGRAPLPAATRRPSTSTWLRRLGVAYVVLTDAPPDHSSRREARLVRSGTNRTERGLHDAAASRSTPCRGRSRSSPGRAGRQCSRSASRASSSASRAAGRIASRCAGRRTGTPPRAASCARPAGCVRLRTPHRGDGANRLRRRREQPVRRVRGPDPNLPESDTSFQVTDCY